MMIITLLATGLLVYVAIAAFAYHDAYELRETRRPHTPGGRADHRHDTADPRLTRFYVLLAAAGALITLGVGLVAHAVMADLSVRGSSLVFSHPMADWVCGIVLAALGVAALIAARRSARRDKGGDSDGGGARA